MDIIANRDKFAKILFERIKHINPGLVNLELYEFQYGLNNLKPEQGDWSAIQLEDCHNIEQRLNDINFYKGIQLKPLVDGRIVLDPPIRSLTNMLFAGLVAGIYPVEWVKQNFYFDIRGFYFLHRTQYLTERVKSHLGGTPYMKFEQTQKKFDTQQDIGYKEFRQANVKVDLAFIDAAKKLVATSRKPIVLAIAGPTAAGKTEIVERLRQAFHETGQNTTSIEMDNFLTDRDYREEMGIHTQGKEAYHLNILRSSLEQVCRGLPISIPRYDFVDATSSHDLNGNLKPGGVPVEVEPAEVIFIEGNFPFLIKEINPLIGIKAVYLTDDPIRLKRKWKRDIDYRKKYEPTYFLNRFFKDQFIMAQIAYIPQLELCDMLVDTTGAALWVTPEVQTKLAP